LLLVPSVNKRSVGLSNGGHGFCGARSWISREMRVADFAWFLGEKAPGSAPFGVCVGDVFPRCRVLRCHGERLDVPELSQESVLIVVTAARYHPPLFIEVADFAEGQRHFAPGRLH
jgi:hypothetical protein